MMNDKMNKKKERDQTKKRLTSRETQGLKSFSKSILIFGIAGTVAIALGVLVYLIVILPEGDKVKLPGEPSYNILLITLDTTRADHLGSYGYEQAKTPHLDSLAREGMRFARVYCPAPTTLPSHCSIMSGLYPITHGVRNNGHNLPPGIKMLAEILKGHGYMTSAFVSSFSVDSRFGIGRGFEVYDDTFQSQMPLKSPNAERRAENTFAKFSRWLDNNWQNKFFTWIHYFDPHLPYDPPLPYREEFEDHLYDGEIAYMDHYVGSVLEELKEKGIIEKTIIVVAGDHGEGLGDKGETGHGIFIYEETLRVPLIFHNLNIFPRPQVIESTVRLIDVAPTILDIIGLKDESAGMQGQSLAGWLKGKSKEDLNSFVETVYPRENFGWSELVGIIEDHWKFIQAPQCELYDLKNDPGEEMNLYSQLNDKASEMAKKLKKELVRFSRFPKNPDVQVVDRTEILKKLGSLGYLSFAPAKSGSVLPDPKEKIDVLQLIQQAQKFEEEEKYHDAEEVYLKVTKDLPESPKVYVNLAIVQARQNKLDLAIDTLRQGIDRIKDSEVLLVRLGHTYLVAGKSQKALETMDKVLDLNPKNVNALTVCADILDATGRKDEALPYYERALNMEPESRHLRMSYAGNLASRGNFREAIKVYETLIDDFPEEQAFYQYAGIAWSYLGELDKAISLFHQALTVTPTLDGYFNLALTYEKNRNFQQALKYFKLYVENSKGESEVNVQKAKAEIKKLEKKLRLPSY
jgi:arylsulfatase A-like enzyme/tetratricopeptide (TPR) repeat protein